MSYFASDRSAREISRQAMQTAIRMFREQMPLRINEIECGISANDQKKVAFYSHQLKGAAACLGFDAIADAAGKIENLARHADGSPMTSATDLFHNLRDIASNTFIEH